MDTKWTPAMPSAKRLLPRAALILASCMAAESLAQDIDPQALTAFLQGVECLEAHEVDAAVERLNKAIRLQPDYAEAYYKRGNCYRQKMLLDQAIEDYGRAIRADADFAKAYCNRGSTYAWLGRTEDATRDHNRAINLDSDYALPRILRGSARLRRGSGTQGKEDLRRGIQLCLAKLLVNPGNETAAFEAGVAYAALQEHDSAIQWFSGAIGVNPNHAEAYIARARTHAEAGREEEALADLAAVGRISPHDALTCCNCAFVFEKLHDYRSSHASYAEAIRLSPTAYRIYLFRADGNQKVCWLPDDRQRQFRHLELALADYLSALKVNPQCEGTRFRSLVSTNWNEATSGAFVNAIDQAIKLSPTCIDARLARVAVCTCLGQDPLPEANRFVAEAPKSATARSATARFVRGTVYFQKGEHAKAVADFTETIRIAPDWVEAYRYRGWVYKKMGRERDAEADFARVTRLSR